ncbi:MAG: hypothetical protein AAB845_02455 [Patescibacteria group bacterium]
MAEPEFEKTGAEVDRLIRKVPSPISVVVIIVGLGALWIMGWFKTDTQLFKRQDGDD